MNKEKFEKMGREYYRIPTKIKEIETEMLTLAETIDTIKATINTGMPHGTGVSDSTYQAVIELLYKRENRTSDLLSEILDLEQQQEIFRKILQKLNIIEKNIVEARFKDELTWEQVGMKLKYNSIYLQQVYHKMIVKIN